MHDLAERRTGNVRYPDVDNSAIFRGKRELKQNRRRNHFTGLVE